MLTKTFPIQRTVCLQRTSLIQPFMFIGPVSLESTSAQVAPSTGILLSMVLNVQLLCKLTVVCTWGKETLKIYSLLN